MSRLNVYLVEVKTHIPGRGSRVRSYHIEAKTPHTASRRCKKRGDVLSVHKAQMFSEFNIQKIPLTKPQLKRTSAITLDELIWLKRNKRRANAYRDKST